MLDNSNNNTKNNFNKNKSTTLYKIPYKTNEYELIKKIHINLNHHNWEDVRKETKKQRIYYYGYINNIKYIISRCNICA